MKKVAELMKKEIISLKEEMTLREAGSLFKQHKISGAPVLSKNGRVLGILSQADIVREASGIALEDYFSEGELVSAEGAIEPLDRLDKCLVGDVLHEDPITIHSAATIVEAAELMRKNSVHRLLVLDDGVLQGLITAFDLLAEVR